MSADTRSTHTDALDTLGSVHTDVQHRDAIHLGVEPVVAGEHLSPGAHICLINGKAFGAFTRDIRPIGIVDPFLTRKINKGERFWLVVYPRKITSLRHVWEHPDFPSSGETSVSTAPVAEQVSEHEVGLMLGDPKALAREWITNYAKELSGGPDEQVTFDDLVDTAMTHVNLTTPYGGEYLVKGGLLEGTQTDKEFWKQLAILKGIDIPGKKRGNFFSCSC